MRAKKLFAFMMMFFVLGLAGCDDEYELADLAEDSITKIHTERTYFKDEKGRYLFMHGVNVSGSTKVPATYHPISYVGKPFPLDEADKNFRILRDLGFNTIRLLTIWEAIEPYAPGEYDEEYLNYLEAIVAKANDYGIYCVIDMHEDMFSRHLMRMFDDETGVNSLEDPYERGIAAPFGLNNKVQGDGAPKWVVQLCLPEKKVGGTQWGLPYWAVSNPVHTTDFFPWTLWGINIFISLDVNRCFATFFAGKDIYPNYMVDGKNVQEFLQDSYTNAWRQVAKRVSKYPNVIGYDIMNEPTGLYVVFTLYSLLYREAKAAPNGELTEDQVRSVLDLYLNDMWEQGATLEAVETVRDLIIENDILPSSISEMKLKGYLPQSEGSAYTPDADAAFNLNMNFNRNYLAPFHSKVGKALLEEDPDAVLFLELSLGMGETGVMGWMAYPMLKPDGLDQIAYAPHWYTDIYPFFGENQPPRDFTVDEKRYRDYTEGINEAILPSKFSLGNPPTVMGEFGTYYNFGGIEKSIEQNYEVSSTVLDIYFETFEEMLLHHLLWCYSPENNKENGEGWNKEDFSLLGPDQKPRSALAYSRPYARFSSGRPVAMHFYSDYHYFDPRPGEPTPYREFYFEFQSKETDAPTEIFVPPVQYPDGIYVYISDGKCAFDPDVNVLYFYPSEDDPETIHTIRIRPPYEDYGDSEWDYFFKEDQVLINEK